MKSFFDKEERLWFFMTPEEEREFHNEVLERVIRNPRYYLDRINHISGTTSLDVYRVSFYNYKPRKLRT